MANTSPLEHLRIGLILCCLAAMIILCYHFSVVELIDDRWSWAIKIGNKCLFASDINPTQGKPLISTWPENVRLPLLNITTTSSAVASENPCRLDWNPNHLNMQSYEKVSNILQEKQSQRSADIQPLQRNPKIVLNTDRFLLPALVWGPNNQLVGMREAVFTAITLNRTFVIPRFKKHGYDKQKHIAPFIAPLHRVDLESLCNFVSCITIDQFRERCNGRVDAIMNTRILKLSEVREIEETFRLRILPPHINDTSLLSNMLVPTNGRKLVFTEDEIETYFSTQAACVVFPFPFLNLHGVRNGGHTNLHGMITDIEMQVSDKNAAEDVRLMISVMQHSQHPRYLKNIADAFQKHFMGDESFLSVHWRYDADDYLSSWNCAHSHFMRKLCHMARNFTNEDFANRISEKLKSLNLTVNNVYIASPRKEIKRIATVAKIMYEKQRIKTFTSLDLEEFMHRYNDCDFLKQHSEDIISTVEMEICSSGIAFIGSDGSWSGNVRNARLFSDDPLLDKSRDDIFVV